MKQINNKYLKLSHGFDTSCSFLFISNASQSNQAERGIMNVNIIVCFSWFIIMLLKSLSSRKGQARLNIPTSGSCVAFNINLSDAGERVEHGMSITTRRRSILLSGDLYTTQYV